MGKTLGSPGHCPAGGVDEEVCELPSDVGQRQQPQLVQRHRPQPHAAESCEIVHKACNLTMLYLSQESSLGKCNVQVCLCPLDYLIILVFCVYT